VRAGGGYLIVEALVVVLRRADRVACADADPRCAVERLRGILERSLADRVAARTF
jgi:hypothetical protein